MRKADFGVNDKTFIVNTHLGNVLNFNDTVLAYELGQNMLSDIDEFAVTDQQLPDVVIVKKTYPKFRNRQKNRFWKLKHFEKEAEAQEEENQVPIDPEDQEEYDRLKQK
jgi:nonsense-mediated mRNA decay protein 3